MKSFFYFNAALLIIGWLIGVVGYNAGGMIHSLLALAMVAVLLKRLYSKES